MEARIEFCDLTGANLAAADLSHAALSTSTLTAANLTRANLTEANLMGANLFGTILTDTNLTRASVGVTAFGRIDFTSPLSLVDIIHKLPSYVSVDALELTASSLAKDPSRTGQVEIFLENAGVPKEYIEFFRSRIGQPIQFYSAFISYSTKDQEFADRLYADLRQKNIRCWLATEDLKIGDRFRTRINDAIRVHDKLLVVLSEYSVKSAWVEDEVEAAFERERRDGTTMLFPIRLDDAVMDSEAAWAASIRHTRHIGDFRHWKDHDEYQKALARLIRDLQADAATAPR